MNFDNLRVFNDPCELNTTTRPEQHTETVSYTLSPQHHLKALLYCHVPGFFFVS